MAPLMIEGEKDPAGCEGYCVLPYDFGEGERLTIKAGVPFVLNNDERNHNRMLVINL